MPDVSAETVTVAGTVTAGLLLDRFRLSPPLGACALSVTAQVTAPEPMTELLLQVRELRCGGAGRVATPSPLKLIIVGLLEEELVTIVN